MRGFAYSLVASTCVCASSLAAQQTTGAIVGTVTDQSGAVVAGAEVKAVAQGTQLTRSAMTSAAGAYTLPDLPIGRYAVTVKREGFATLRIASVEVQSNRTITLPANLSLGEVSTAVQVDANPLLNATDTTNGYVLDREQIANIPQPTGSFTGMAVLTPGVNSELPSGSGASDGLGNMPIWANGQRDTSNSFTINGVDASTLFNGKSTSAQNSTRLTSSTGVINLSGGGGVVQTTASVYLSIGNSLPTPAPEFLTEVRVNASMYDAQQGSTSGAHIDALTASGTNQFHGRAYGRRMTDWLNAAPFFFKNDPAIDEAYRKPQLHRWVLGGTLGGPIVKNKLFGFVGFQHLHVSDGQLGASFLQVPYGLSDTTRDAGSFANLVNAQFGTGLAASNIDSTALALFNVPSVAGESGKWLVPNQTTGAISVGHPYNAFLPGTARFNADTAVADVDWNATAKDTVAFKFFYQNDPTRAPYAFSDVPGFTQHLESGAQLASVTNTYLVKPNLSTQVSVGWLRERMYTDNEQPFGPSSIPTVGGATASIDTFGSNYFPGVSIVGVLGNAASNNGITAASILNIGPNAAGQGSLLGIYQNRVNPTASASWLLGKHTVNFGSEYSYTQLNTIDNRTGKGTVATDDLSAFAQGFVTPGGAATQFFVSSFLQGDASRYYRANQLGLFLQDKYQVTPTFVLTAGIRYDWSGGLTEKYGRLFNFDPSRYGYDQTSDTITGTGLIIAGNNTNGTAGVSPTTLTGRQWGIAPRLGAAWQPAVFRNKVVVRSGFGMYFDRGELYSYFSPGYAIGTVTGGPFGVNQQLPFVNNQQCRNNTLYNGYIPTCGGNAANDPYGAPEYANASTGNLAHPYTNVQQAAPQNPKASDLAKYLPNLYSIENPYASDAIHEGQPISLGVYDRRNTLPYTFNYTLNLQWQPRNDVAVELGYVGNVGRHQVIPIPLNQPKIASPSSPVNGQHYTYGYTVSGATLPDGSAYLADYEGGNVNHRVPYVGYAAESVSYRTVGIDSYNALQARVDKRLTHGLQVGVSYTWSHALDEHSGMGLFFNGNNPDNLRDSYATSDFDRTHVLNFNYRFDLPSMFGTSDLKGKLTSGWSLVGLTVLESGQPYSVIDYTGAVGSMYYSTNDGIINAVVPLAPGCTPKNAKTGLSGAFGDEALKPGCFVVQTLAPGAMGGAIPASDPYETNFTKGQRNIFRQSFQKRADASLVKQTSLTDHYSLRYSLDVYNLTNSASFDIPGNQVYQNANYNSFPGAAGSYAMDVAPSAATCSTAAGRATAASNTNNYFYNCADGVGTTTHTIGSPRQIQMSLALNF